MNSPWYVELLNTITKQYRIEPLPAQEFLDSYLNKPHPLSTYINEHRDDPLLTRSREFKQFKKMLKKDLYYSLRQYTKNDTGNLLDELHKVLDAHPSPHDEELQAVVNRLVSQHRSTAERVPFISDFNSKLASHYKAAETIVDLGGGIYPLQFPFADLKKLKQYVVVEGQESSVSVLQAWQRLYSEILTIIPHNLSVQNWQQIWSQLPSEPDLVLMYKFIPVVQRQQHELIPLLAKIPGKHVILTGSSEALVKRQDIKHREDKILKQFIALTKRPILEKFEIGNEFGYILGNA